MAKALAVSFCFSNREFTLARECRQAAIQIGVKDFLPSRLILVRSAHEREDRPGLGKFSFSRTPQGCQTSSSFFTGCLDNLSARSSSHLQRLKQRKARNEEGPVLDWQWSPSAKIGSQGKSEIEGNSKVDIMDDYDYDDDESRDRVLEEQFNRFAIAMALQDNQMAERVMKEMGNPVKMVDMKNLVNEVNEMQAQLEELYRYVTELIEEGDKDTAREMIEANHEVIVEQLESGYQGMEQVAMLDILAQLRMSLRDFEEAESLLDQTKDLMEVVGVDSTTPLADSILEHVGSMYTALGKPAEGLPFFVRSIDIQEELLGKESPLIVKTLLGLATTYCDMDDTLSAIEVYKKALSILEKMRGPTDESLALPLSHLGHCLLEEGRVDEAEFALIRILLRNLVDAATLKGVSPFIPFLEVLQESHTRIANNLKWRALKLVEKIFGVNDGRVGIATCALARAKAARGAVDESVSLYQKGLQIMEGCSKFTSDDPAIETVRTDLAELLNLVERNDEAEKLWEETLVIKEKAVGPNDPSLVVHLQNLATSYAVSGKYEKCEPLLRRSLKLTTANLGPHAPQVSVPLECLATALHHMDRQYEAEPLARQALHIREAAYGPESPIVGEACNCLASILHSIGRFEEALGLMKRVLAIQERVIGPDSQEIVLTLELIIMLLDKLGWIDDIEPHYLRLATLSTAFREDDMLDMSDSSP